MDAIKIYSSIPFEKIDCMIKKIPMKKNINVEYKDDKDISIYSFFLKKHRPTEEIAFLNVLSDFVYEMMIKFHAMDLVESHVYKFLADIGSIEKKKIIEGVYILLVDDQYFINEKEEIKEEILDFLLRNDSLIVEGYIRFRNGKLDGLIEKAIKRVMGDIQLEIEYSEFIDVLRHFLENQPSRIDTINLILEDNGFKLLNKDDREVKRDSISEILEEIYSDDLTQGDILITTLINLAPENIILHNRGCKDDKLLLVIEKVFKDRIEICLGCNKCKTSEFKRKE